MKTIESLSQPNELYSEVPNCAEFRRQQEAMSSELALAAIQSMLENGADEDVKPVGQVAMSLRAGVGECEGSLEELTHLRKQQFHLP